MFCYIYGIWVEILIKKGANVNGVEILGVEEDEINSILKEYEEILSLPGRGIKLLHVAGGYKLATKGAYYEAVEKVVKPQGGQLSKAALETLTIIAYKQPITRSEIEGIRGVSADSMIYKLLEKDLIYGKMRNGMLKMKTMKKCT